MKCGIAKLGLYALIHRIQKNTILDIQYVNFWKKFGKFLGAVISHWDENILNDLMHQLISQFLHFKMTPSLKRLTIHKIEEYLC